MSCLAVSSVSSSTSKQMQVFVDLGCGEGVKNCLGFRSKEDDGEYCSSATGVGAEDGAERREE